MAESNIIEYPKISLIVPTYLPSITDLRRIMESDYVIFLDSAPCGFIKSPNKGIVRSKTSPDDIDSVKSLRVPYEPDRGRPLNECRIDQTDPDTGWRKQHALVMNNVYSECLYGVEVVEIIDAVINRRLRIPTSLTSSDGIPVERDEYLGEFTWRILKRFFMGMLPEKTDFKFSLDHRIVFDDRTRTIWYHDLCNWMITDQQLSGLNLLIPSNEISRIRQNVFENSSIEITEWSWECPPFGPWKAIGSVPNELSCIDLVAELSLSGAGEFLRKDI